MSVKQLTMQHEELVHVQGERDRLQMVGEDPHSRRDIVEQAKKDRDLAIEKYVLVIGTLTGGGI